MFEWTQRIKALDNLSNDLTLVFLSLFLFGCGEVLPTASAQSLPRIFTTELTQAQANGTVAGLYRPGQLPTECNWAGTAASANISTFYAADSLPLKFARWVITVTPYGGGARLIAYDASDYVIVELARVQGNYTGPWSTGAYVDLQQFITAGNAYKFLGVQVCGDAHLYSSRIEVVYQVGAP